MLPLQAALGYDLAQSLFAQQRNLVLEGLTDYWYVDACAGLLREAGLADLDENIALVPAGSASKVVYFATILHAQQLKVLHAQQLKVAALLDSDSAGDDAAKQDTLVHQLGKKRILRTKDVYSGDASRPEIEDLLRDTLIAVAKVELRCDVTEKVLQQPNRPIVELLEAEIEDFSKYRLGKAFLRWAREHGAVDLSERERTDLVELVQKISAALA